MCIYSGLNLLILAFAIVVVDIFGCLRINFPMLIVNMRKSASLSLKAHAQ